jgi:hypothetical protein
MTRRETAALLIGLGLGLLMSEAVLLEVFFSLHVNGSLNGYSFHKIGLVVPILLLVPGIALLAYRKKPERIPQ